MIICFAGPALANTVKPVDLYFNSQPVELKAFVVEGRTLVPVRFISEKLGADVKWDGETQTVGIRGFGKDVMLYIGKRYAVVNEETVTLNAAPVVSSGVTWVPVRFVSETLGTTVRWDGYAVRIFSSSKAETDTQKVSRSDPQASISLPVVPENASEKFKKVKGIINSSGNTLGNLVSSGLVAKQGEWIYFTSGETLFKIKTDGTQLTKIYENELVSSLNVIGDWIYFRGHGDIRGIWKIKTDGSNLTSLTRDYIRYLYVQDGWIYYVNESDTTDGYRTLYKMRIDSTRKTKISNIGVQDFFVVDEWI